MEQIMEYAAKETPWKQIPAEMWLDLLRSGEPQVLLQQLD